MVTLTLMSFNFSSRRRTRWWWFCENNLGSLYHWFLGEQCCLHCTLCYPISWRQSCISSLQGGAKYEETSIQFPHCLIFQVKNISLTLDVKGRNWRGDRRPPNPCSWPGRSQWETKSNSRLATSLQRQISIPGAWNCSSCFKVIVLYSSLPTIWTAWNQKPGLAVLIKYYQLLNSF